MASLTKQIPRFMTAARSAQNGPWGFLQKMFGGFGTKGSGIIGTINIPSGSTSVVVTDTGVTATDVFFVTVMTKGANASSYIGVSAIVAGTSYTLNVSADPGAGGVTLAVIRLPAQMLFAN